MKKKIITISIIIILIVGYIFLSKVLNNYINKEVQNSLSQIKNINGLEVSYSELDFKLVGMDIVFKDIYIKKNEIKILVDEIKIDKVDLNSNIPYFAKLKATGIHIKNNFFFKSFGYDEVTLDLLLSYEYDPYKKYFNINQITLSSDNVAKIDGKMNFKSVILTNEYIVNYDKLLSFIKVDNIELQYRDKDLISKILSSYSSLMGLDKKYMMQNLAIGLSYLSEVQEDDIMHNLYKNLSKIALKPEMFTIFIEPDEPKSVKDISNITEFEKIVKLLNVNIES